MTKKQKIISLILELNSFSSVEIKKRLNLSKNKAFKSTTKNYINRVFRYLIKRKLIIKCDFKRSKKANNYPIPIYSINSQLINKLINI